jgi:hypothetical protein
LVADLRLTVARYPADQRLQRLIGDLAVQSPRFVELWESDGPEQHQDFGRHKVIDHPDVVRITLDCDVLIVAADGLRIMIYTAEPETVDAERLTLAIVLGGQAFHELIRNDRPPQREQTWAAHASWLRALALVQPASKSSSDVVRLRWEPPLRR